MASIIVRVVPRSGRTAVEVGSTGVVLRVRSAPAAGRANDEARSALADALGIPPSRISVRSGARSRTKVFEVEGLSEAQLGVLLGTT